MKPARRWRQGALALVTASLLLQARDARSVAWPDRDDRIARELASPDPGVRRHAVSEMRTLGRAEAAAFLGRALDDSDPDVRLLAAACAHELRATVSASHFTAWFASGDSRLRVAALRLVHGGESAVLTPLVVRAIDDSDEMVRLAAAEASVRLGTSDAVDALVGKIDDPSADVRKAIVEALGEIGEPHATSALIAATTDVSREVRAMAAKALGLLDDVRAVSPLLRMLETDAVLTPRLFAASSLGHLRSPLAVPSLTRATMDPSLPLRRAAVAALGEIPSHEAIAPLVHLLGGGLDVGLDDGSTGVRRALIAHGDAAIPELVGALHSSHADTATGAAYCLGELRATGVARDVLAAVRRGAVTDTVALGALAAIGDEGAVEYALESLGHRSPAVRAAARRALRILLPRLDACGIATGPIAAALDAVRPEVERDELLPLLAMCRAGSGTSVAPHTVGAVRSPDAEADATLLLLRDASWRVRADAVWAMGDVGRAKDLASVVAMTSADEDGVAANAVAAVARIAERIGDGRPGSEAKAALCDHVGDARPLSRRNALSGLALLAARCGTGEAERNALEDEEAYVRVAAARALRSAQTGSLDRAAFRRCAFDDPSLDVVDACATPWIAPRATDRVVVSPRVSSTGDANGLFYAVEFADGLVRSGVTDASGNFVEPYAPRGAVRLLPLRGGE